MSSNYAKRGVSAGKEEVHAAISHLDKGLYPRAFCKILPDLSTGDPDWCSIMHADGAGTKSALAYLYWKETGDLSVWRGIAQDAIVMNTDDMLCAGATGPFIFSNTIGRNKFYVGGEVLSEMLQGMEEFFEMLRSHGVGVTNAGGETADVGDIVKTLIHDATAFTRLPRKQVITNEGIRAGDVIVGLASFGQTIYEKEYNGGIGSNGLTNARHDLLSHVYAEKYPETFDSHIPSDLVYSGKYLVTDQVDSMPIPVGKALLSPTRTFLPVMKPVLDRYRDKIHGLIHCTGGGQSKVKKFIDQVHVVKSNLFPTPPLFSLIQQSSGASWAEMYEVLNMGHRMEIYTDEETAKAIIDIAGSFELGARIVGVCHPSDHPKVTVEGEETVVFG
ncbi:MAG: phosphoribosylformylglycinamidine cyclo-ligase [Bacteroidia bacterium]|nr:phosphoribosylformylglycinamidine cyclo-ligase [Bacteroidia bacterium]